MRNSNLVRYFFEDGSEILTTQRGRVMAIKEPDSGYLYIQGLLKRRVRGSMPEPYSKKVSKTPKKGEHLLTAQLLGFRGHVSRDLISRIDRNFQFSF